MENRQSQSNYYYTLAFKIRVTILSLDFFKGRPNRSLLYYKLVTYEWHYSPNRDLTKPYQSKLASNKFN